MNGIWAALVAVATICLPAATGCTNLNHWEGPRYRDDPVVSDLRSPAGGNLRGGAELPSSPIAAGRQVN